MAGSPHVFTIPASVPFLPALIRALLDGRLVENFPKADDPLSLATATLYLPTRRACRLARDIFLDQLGTDAAILPRIAAIGDIDEDEIVFAQSATGALAAQALDLPGSLDGLDRTILLAKQIQAWASAIAPESGAPLVANNPASAFALAQQLARLLDDMITRQVSWDKLDSLVPDEHDKYWQLTLRFLENRATALARNPRRTRCHRGRRTARPADRSRDQTAESRQRRPGHRRRLDRLDALDRDAA